MKTLITSLILMVCFNSSQAGEDRFAPPNPNQQHYNMQERARDSSAPTNTDYITSHVLGRVNKHVREKTGNNVINDNKDGDTFVNSVVVSPGSKTGDVYIINKGENNIVNR